MESLVSEVHVSSCECSDHVVSCSMCSSDGVSYDELMGLFDSSGQPDAPTDLELTDPGARSVQLTWTPGDEHNSAIKSTTASHTCAHHSDVCVCVCDGSLTVCVCVDESRVPDPV